MDVNDLRCEYLTDPLGLDLERFLLTWRLTEATSQREFRIRAAWSHEDLIEGREFLDTGRIDASNHRFLFDHPVEARRGVWWNVEAGAANDFGKNEPAYFEKGLELETERVCWIGLPRSRGARDGYRPSPLLRREFELPTQPSRARLYISALGLYRVWLNGIEASEELFRPGWTHYGVRVQYQTYDIGHLIVGGRNAIAVMLADGWYAGYLGTEHRREQYGDNPQLWARLVFEDGSGETTIETDESWTGSFGQVLSSDIYKGEIHDDRLEPIGWTRSSFDDSGWSAAQRFEGPVGRLIGAPVVSVKRQGHIEPIEISEPRLGYQLVDMGRNFAGRVRIQVEAPEGTELVLRHAEMLNPGGQTLYVDNLRHADATDRFIVGPDGKGQYEPSFTYHGFRYVEVAGYPGELSADKISGVPIRSDVRGAGSFNCSDDRINRLFETIVRTYENNWFEVPTDCPNRDERLGWTGDATICARTACYLFDAMPFYAKWLDDVLDARTDEGIYTDVAPKVPPWTVAAAPGWGDGGVVVPWQLYEFYGDERVLERNIEAMKRWVDYPLEANQDHVWRNDRGNDYGDWLSVGADTPKDLLATALWYRCADVVARACEVLSDPDSHRYTSLAASIKSAFIAEYVAGDGSITGDTQTAYALGLRFGLVPSAVIRAAVDRLVGDIERRGNVLSTGFLGTEHLLPALAENGRLDVAYRLLLSDRFPSWLYFIQNGATTMWEHWDSWTPESGFKDPFMNSFSHCSLGSVASFLMEYVAGIAPDPARPGTGWLIRPRPGPGIDEVEASHDRLLGEVSVNWRKHEDVIRVRVDVPSGCTAKVRLPSDEGWTPVGPGRHELTG